MLLHQGLQGLALDEFSDDCPLAVYLPHLQQLRDAQTGLLHTSLVQCLVEDIRFLKAVSKHLDTGISFMIAGFFQSFQQRFHIVYAPFSAESFSSAGVSP